MSSSKGIKAKTSDQFHIPFFGNALRIQMSKNGIKEIFWLKKLPTKSSPLTSQQKRLQAVVNNFVNGKGPLEVQLDWDEIEGTEFQKSVWKKMIQIPYGKTKSYGEIAKSLKKPGAARAVGTACGNNPVLLAIPCHRVVGSTGLGGFSGGGLGVKRQLLSIEKSLI